VFAMGNKKIILVKFVYMGIIQLITTI